MALPAAGGTVSGVVTSASRDSSQKGGFTVNDKNRINPELRSIAHKIPYSKWMIPFANLYQSIAYRLTAVPKEVTGKTIFIEGYQGLKLKTDIFTPSEAEGTLPCLIYAHGGAFSYKASVYHKKLACIYAARANCQVFFPDYHLLPQYPYPAAYEDVLALYRWILRNAEALRVDPERIGAAGDSAGAALAALLCSRWEQEGLPMPCLQMLVYPVTDSAMQTASMKRFSDTPLWNAENNRRMWQYYSGNWKGEDQYGPSPMHSSLPEKIPDAYIETAEYDCLHDEGILYGEKLREAGAAVEINETVGTVHGYDVALRSGIAMENVEKRVSFLLKGFDKK